MSFDDNYDFAIIGAGITGSTLALALSKLYKELPQTPKILLLERHTQHAGQTMDARALAISLGALSRLDELGVGDTFTSQGESITTIHISDQGHLGRLELQAFDFGFPYFGKVVLLPEVESALWQKLSARQEIVKLIRPCSVCEVRDSVDSKVIVTTTGEQYRSKVIIIAEGGNSQLCHSLGVEYLKKEFEHSAIVTSLSFADPDRGRAWERFTSNGPLAILPIAENWFSVVWCLDSKESSRLIKSSEIEFKSELQRAFGYRAGRIEDIGPRQLFPLRESISKQQSIGSSVYLFGNATHMLHPVAGQGFNLTVRDISLFVSTYAEKIMSSRFPLPIELGVDYNESRQRDVKEISHYTSCLISTFSSSLYPVVAGRCSGLALMARNRYLREKIVALGANVNFF